MTTDFDTPLTLVQRAVTLAGIAVVFAAGALLAAQNYDYAIGLILMIAATIGVLWIALLRRAVAWLIPTLLGVTVAILMVLAVRVILPTMM